MTYCIYLFIKYRHIPIEYTLFILFAIIKTTLEYRICSLAYIECKLRKIKRGDSYINQFLDPIVDLRYTDHIYPLFILAYSVVYLSLVNYLRKYISK